MSSPQSWQTYAEELHRDERERLKAAKRRRMMDLSLSGLFVVTLGGVVSWLLTQ